MKYVDYGLI